MESEFMIVSIVALCILMFLFVIWNERRMEKAILLQLFESKDLASKGFEMRNTFHIRAIGNYRGFDVAIGIKDVKEKKGLILELLLKTPTGFEMKIHDPQSLLWRKAKNSQEVWIGKYLPRKSEFNLKAFDTLIERIEKGKTFANKA